MKFIWDQKYSVGIDEIDEQHQNFFRITNDLDKLLEKYTNKDEFDLEIKFDELLNYVLYHFSSEEEYFEKCHYPDTQEHVRQHSEYREKMRQYREEIRRPEVDKLSLGKEAHEYATEWLKAHILGSDQKYTSCLTECIQFKKSVDL